jgi:hypothetical protein
VCVRCSAHAPSWSSLPYSYFSIRCSALTRERLAWSFFDQVSEVVVASLLQLLLRLRTKEHSFLGVGHARLVEEVGELFKPLLLLRLRLLKLVNEVRLLELKLLGFLFELVDLGLVEVSVLVLKLLSLLPPLANEVLPLLLAEFA